VRFQEIAAEELEATTNFGMPEAVAQGMRQRQLAAA
jgi:hypothetical protein